jgi:DNA-binding response OmpR family regulator
MRIALHHVQPPQAARLTQALRFAGHEVTPFEGVHALLVAAGGRTVELVAASAGALARHEPRRELADLRSAGIPVLAFGGLDDGDALTALAPDDYLLEPFRDEELALRATVLARRTRGQQLSKQLEAPPNELRADTREILLHGRPVELTAREFELALFLFRRMGLRVARSEIAEQVWGRLPHATSRTLDAHISSLRRKLALDATNGYRLAAHYGHGYCLTPVTAK